MNMDNPQGLAKAIGQIIVGKGTVRYYGRKHDGNKKN